MRNLRESKYDSLLRQLGFFSVSIEEQKAFDAELFTFVDDDTLTSSNDKEILREMLETQIANGEQSPRFRFEESCTIVIDEYHQKWRAPKRLDMSLHGFREIGDIIKAHILRRVRQLN